nr:MAG TPA: tail tape measure protein [Caudoviricetes sp.]
MANSSRVKGITVKIGGDVSGLDKALQKVNKEINDTQAKLKDVKRLLRLDPGNTELLRQKQELLSKAVGETKDKLEQLKDAEKQLRDSGIDENSAQFQSLRREVIETESSLDDLTRAANQSNTALEKIGATADKVASGAQKVADATAGISRTAQAGLAAAAAATVKIVDSYADYEQLIGGVETLFKGDAKTLVNYANNAYKTAGLSANAYMETATGFAASLVSSLGGDTRKAVEMADMAITDMADNANKMGSDIRSIQNAYQGFAKQNYTMLDNLKLGFGGTKEEMQRLLEEAEALSGVKYDIGNYADIVNAIHVIQTEMGITGTTAKEAEGTISGSIAAFKASVSNLLAGMGDANADVGQLTDNMIAAFQTMADNIIPILQNIWDHLPGGAKFALIGMGAVAAISPVAGAVANIGNAVNSLTTIIPKIGTAFSSMASFVMANPIVLLIAAIVALVVLIATKGDEIQALLQKLDDWLQGVFAKDWTELFGPVLGEQLNGFFASVKNIWDSIKQVFDGVIDFIRGVFTGDWQRAWEGVKEIFRGTFNAFASLAKVPINSVIALLNGAINGINMMIDALNSISFKIPDWVPLLGGKSFGLHLARVGSIPYLAKGGILSQGSAVVGEAGPELLTLTGGKAVVQPLSGNGPSLKGVEGLLGGISDKLGAGQPVTIVVQSVLDGRVIGETAYDYAMQRARARG